MRSPVVLAMFLVSSSALAASTPDDRDHALPCRPTISCTADLAAPGTLEVEAGWVAQKGTYGSSFAVPFLLKQTVSKLLQFQAGSNGVTFVRPARTTYFDNVLLGAKLHLGDQSKWAPSFAVTALVGVPNYSGLEAFVTGHASKDIGPIHGDLNLGIAESNLDSTPVSQGFGALALSATVWGPLGAAAEVYFYTDSPPVLPHDGGFRFVLTATPKPWLVFDMGGDAGFFPSVRAFSLFFGITIVPVVFWR